VLSHQNKNRFEKSQITFDQIKAVKQVKSVKPSHTARSVLVGAVDHVSVLAGPASLPNEAARAHQRSRTT
jgi:hypothetical protein